MSLLALDASTFLMKQFLERKLQLKILEVFSLIREEFVETLPFLDCAVKCKGESKRFFALRDTSCFCFDSLPYESFVVANECINFYASGYFYLEHQSQ